MSDEKRRNSDNDMGVAVAAYSYLLGRMLQAQVGYPYINVNGDPLFVHRAGVWTNRNIYDGPIQLPQVLDELTRTVFSGAPIDVDSVELRANFAAINVALQNTDRWTMSRDGQLLVPPQSDGSQVLGINKRLRFSFDGAQSKYIVCRRDPEVEYFYGFDGGRPYSSEDVEGIPLETPIVNGFIDLIPLVAVRKVRMRVAYPEAHVSFIHPRAHI